MRVSTDLEYLLVAIGFVIIILLAVKIVQGFLASQGREWDVREHGPLDRAWLCLDCEEVGWDPLNCPACGAKQMFLLERWLDRRIVL
jgi:hypothetical protein